MKKDCFAIYLDSFLDFLFANNMISNIAKKDNNKGKKTKSFFRLFLGQILQNCQLFNSARISLSLSLSRSLSLEI